MLTTGAQAQPLQPGPEVDVSLVFDPARPVVGREAVFTIFAFRRVNGTLVSGADLPVMVDGPLASLSSMQMSGGVIAKELRPGVYQFPFTFSRSGDYILHVHVLPKGETNMMRNHADFGLLRVAGGSVVQRDFLFPFQMLSIVLIAIAVAQLVVHRLYTARRWLKISGVILGALGVVVGVSDFLMPEQVPLAELPETTQLPKSNIIMLRGGSYRFDQKENFVPDTVLAIIGFNNTLTWQNADSSSHSIVHIDDEPKFTSPLLNPGQTWTHTFTDTGIYYYYCLPHPWMLGAIEVVKP